jgi:lipopolysaccharide/colanic/teichoic acid biosynthesis glycosyltransferase
MKAATPPAHAPQAKEPATPSPLGPHMVPRKPVWRARAQRPATERLYSCLDQSWYGACKMALEWTFAAVLLVIAAPIMLFAGLLVKLTSRGSLFYSQTRVGKDGKLFTIYKIRTMVANCESKSGAQWATVNDPRITPVGAFLRKTHIDELPQLFNILRCEMSLVGPRPERPEFVPALENAIPHYCDRLLVRPGVTGVAQVQLPPDTDLASVQRKLAYDLYYVRHASFWLDVRLVLCTAIHVVGVPFHVIGRLFHLPGRETVETAYHQQVQAAKREREPAMLPLALPLAP